MPKTYSDLECEEACEALVWLSELPDPMQRHEELESLPCQLWARVTAVVFRFVTVYWSGRKQRYCWRDLDRFASFPIAESKIDCSGQLVLATLLENVGLESLLCSASWVASVEVWERQIPVWVR